MPAGTTNYPTTLDTDTNLPSAGTLAAAKLSGGGNAHLTHSNLHGVVSGALQALEARVGANVFIGRAATRVVAASDATAAEIAQADYTCDGTADEVQIQSAITDVTTKGGSVHLTSGTFYIAAPITIRVNQASTTLLAVRLQGTGYGTKLQSTVSGDILQISNQNAAAYIYGPVVEDLMLSGNSVAGSSGILITRGNQVALSRLLLVNFRGYATRIVNSQVVTVSRSYYNGTVPGSGVGVIEINGGTTTNLLDNYLSSNGGSGTYGVLIDEHSAGVIDGNRIESSGTGIYLQLGTVTNGVRNTRIVNNYFEAPNTYHIALGAGSSGARVIHTIIQHNYFSMSNTASVAGIYLHRAQNTVIDENDFVSNGGAGASDILASSAAGASLANNRLGQQTLTAAGISGDISVGQMTPPTYVNGTTDFYAPISLAPATTVQALAYAATVTPSLDLGAAMTLTLTGNVAFAVPTSDETVRTGSRITFLLLQDATGGRTVTWNAGYAASWSDTGNTANKRSAVSFVYNGSTWIQDAAQVGWY